MLGCDSELTADMVFAKLAEKGVVFICHEIIKAYSRAYKDFFDAVYFSDFSQQFKIVLV